MFIENFSFGQSELFVVLVFSLGVVIGAVGIIVFSIITGRWRKEENWRKQFKKYFGMSIDWRYFTRDTSYKSWRDKRSKEQIIIQYGVDTVLSPRAKIFLDFCEKRNKLMEPYYSAQSGERVETELNNKKDLKRSEKLENDISLAEDKFQNAVKAAKEGGFQVKASAREYIKKETKQVVEEEEEKES